MKYPEPNLPPAKNPGDYYSNKARAATYWGNILNAARAIEDSEETINAIQDRLEMARYVGD